MQLCEGPLYLGGMTGVGKARGQLRVRDAPLPIAVLSCRSRLAAVGPGNMRALIYSNRMSWAQMVTVSRIEDGFAHILQS
jgi:hypothetical protein